MKLEQHQFRFSDRKGKNPTREEEQQLPPMAAARQTEAANSGGL
jgi:hypothetical protein